jgi:hypothetical protein
VVESVASGPGRVTLVPWAPRSEAGRLAGDPGTP